jgi:molybdopterin-guanine dinucleotide biosynthesis protein A
MAAGGYVLTGGASSRLGRDKALLAYHGHTLVEHIAAQLQAACGHVTLVGAPDRYRHLGLPVIDEPCPGRGPLSGIAAALAHTEFDWNLILACDQPGVTAALLARLLAAARAGAADAVALAGEDGSPEPLCAAYHRRLERNCRAELAANRLSAGKMLQHLRLTTIRRLPGERLGNVNTAEDWTAWSH